MTYSLDYGPRTPDFFFGMEFAFEIVYRDGCFESVIWVDIRLRPENVVEAFGPPTKTFRRGYFSELIFDSILLTDPALLLKSGITA